MSDQDSILKLNLNRRAKLTAEVTYLMLKGAGYAALVFFGTWICIAIIAAVGRSLPEGAQNNPDPAPQNFIAFEQSVPVPMNMPATASAADAAASE
ncbi:MAG: RC-LH1 core complex protein PufX [Rhodobacterales bacterium]|nr:RC-LH1 core complex protein PufX [Rhodobacterales bacterium]